MATEIGDGTPEGIIPAAINGEQGALESLIVHPWTAGVFDEVSGWAKKEYQQDRDEIRQILALAACASIRTVTNPYGLTWCHCLQSWFYAVAKHHCWNEGRHNKVVRRHRDGCASDAGARGRLKSTSGGANAIQSSATADPEQELAHKEAYRKLIESFPRQQRVIELWWQGHTPKEIADKTGKSVKTIYPILKKVQKALTKNLGVTFKEKKNEG